jgi:2-polyprenyl-3-methyl-5-hydroxy-6-metoxy-1,4-benzoquinol methylase
MKIDSPDGYGTVEWFENLFKLSDDDPWGHGFRGIEECRHELIFDLIKEHLPKGRNGKGDLRILDVGCAIGDFTKRLYDLDQGVIGMDISRTAIDKAKAKRSDIDFRVGSLPAPDLRKESFDLITCLEVLYYMDNDTQKVVLSEINHLLDKGGRAIFSATIGEKPYFKPEALIDLLSEHFGIEAVRYYYASGYYIVEKKIFRKYQQLSKLRRGLRLNCNELKGVFKNNAMGKTRVMRSVLRLATLSPSLHKVIFVFVNTLLKGISIILSWKFPAKICNYVSKKLSLGRSHAIVLVSKRLPVNRVWLKGEKASMAAFR